MAFSALGGVLPAALNEVNRLVAFDLVDHFGLHASVGNEGQAHVVANHQNFIKLNLIASFGSDLFDAQYITCGDSVLFAAGF